MHADQRRAPHVFILWAEPPLMVRPISAHEGIGVYTPTISICIVIITVMRLRALLNLFNVGDQIVHNPSQVVHLFSDECCKFTLRHTIIEIRRRSYHG